MIALKVTQVDDDSLGLLFPSDLLARLNWKAGDTVMLTECASGFSLSTSSAELEEQIKIGRRAMREHRDVLHALAQRDTPEPD